MKSIICILTIIAWSASAYAQDDEFLYRGFGIEVRLGQSLDSVKANFSAHKEVYRSLFFPMKINYSLTPGKAEYDLGSTQLFFNLDSTQKRIVSIVIQDSTDHLNPAPIIERLGKDYHKISFMSQNFYRWIFKDECVDIFNYYERQYIIIYDCDLKSYYKFPRLLSNDTDVRHRHM